MGELDPVDPAPGPARRVGAIALLELVERGRQRLERQLVPRVPADELWIGLVPQLDQPRLETPRRGHHRRESELRARAPAFRVVRVTDHRLGHGAREVCGERRVDGSRDRPGIEAVIPALQPLERADFSLSGRAEAGEPVRRLLAWNRMEVELDALEVIERVLVAL